MIGCYPSLSLHDPKIYIAELVTLLTRYSLEIGEKAIEKAKSDNPKFIPSVPEVANACREFNRDDAWNYAQQFAANSRQQLLERQEREEADQREPLEHRRRAVERILAEYRSGLSSEQRKTIETPESVMEKYGLSRAQWDALPDAEPGKWQKLCDAHKVAT